MDLTWVSSAAWKKDQNPPFSKPRAIHSGTVLQPLWNILASDS